MISIVFTASENLLARLVRWITRSTVSHVMIEYPSAMWGGKWVAESSVTGVRKVPAEKAKKHVMAEFRCKFRSNEGLQKISKYFGQFYDVGGLFVVGWYVIIWRWFKRKVKKPLNNTDGQFCSELVARFFMSQKLPNTEKWDPELITPADLLKYCTDNPELFEAIK